MFQKLFAAIIIGSILMVSISACGSGDKSTSKSTTFNGVWTSSNPHMSADIFDETIEITIISDDVRGLYWKGTFPKSVSEDTTFVSNGDTKAMNISLLGSQDSKKKFTYSDNELSFELGMLGTIQTIHLKK